MSPRDHYAALLSLTEMLEELSADFQADRRNGDDPTHAHQALVDALMILHSILSDLEKPCVPRAQP